MSTIASNAVNRIADIAETAWTTTPATPAFQVMRLTDAGIKTDKTTKAVIELATHRNVADEVQTFQAGSAAYKGVMSYGSFDDWLANVMFGAWTTNVLKNGVTRTSRTIEEMLNLNGSLSFTRLTGAMADTFSLDVTAQDVVNIGFNFKGQKETLDTAIISGATYTAANTKVPMSAGVSVGSLAVASLTTPAVRKVSIAVKNSLRDRPTVDSLYSLEYGEGACEVTGSVELYFKSNAHYQKVLDHGGGDLTFILGTVTAEKYTVDMPNIVFLNGARQTGGVNNDVMINIPIRARYDSSSGASMSITRAVA